MHDGADALDGDGLALQSLGPLRERCRIGDAGGVGDILAQHEFDQRLVDQVGDSEHPLSRRSSAQEHRPSADGEVGAARDHRIGRGYANQDAVRDLQAFLLVESGILGDERRTEGQRRGRQGHQDFDILRGTGGGKQPNGEREGDAARCRCLNIRSSLIVVANEHSVSERKPQESVNEGADQRRGGLRSSSGAAERGQPCCPISTNTGATNWSTATSPGTPFNLTSYPPNSPLSARPDWRQKSGLPGGDLDMIRSQALDPFGSPLRHLQRAARRHRAVQ